MIWGLTSGGWMRGLLPRTGDPYRAQLELLASYDLHATGWSVRRLLSMEPDRREQIAGWLEEFNVRIGLGVGFDYFSDDPDEVKRGTDGILEAIETLAGPFRAPACTSGIRQSSTSFTREPSVEEQVDRLAEVLAPIAEAAHRAGCPLGLHNSGHYCSDLAELCRRTPHLGILFDTGNPFLVGERPIRAAEAAAPYVIGTHFKDHYVWPNKQSSPLCLEMSGAVLGGGDACLREVYDILHRNTPDFDNLVMEMEIDPVHGLTQQEALEKSLEFVRSL